MNATKRIALLKQLQEREAKFVTNEVNLTEIERMVDDLVKIPQAHRSEFSDFCKGFIENLFKQSVNVSGIGELKRAFGMSSSPEKRKSSQGKPDFNTLLKNFLQAIPSYRQLKNSFLFEFLLDASFEYELVVIHDENYFISPFRKALQAKAKNVTFVSINDIQSFFASNSQSNFLCLLLIAPKINDQAAFDILSIKINELINLFDYFNYITVNHDKFESSHNFFTKNSDKDSFLDEFRYVGEHFLTHSDLEFEEEKIIKKLFKDLDFPILDYSLLKGGKSGAKVIEITPKKKTADSKGKKYVIKISAKKEKINKENKRFKTHVADFGDLADKYRMDSAETANYAGIKYEYASTGKLKRSRPLSDIIEDTENAKSEKITEIVSGLFNEKCFTGWRSELNDAKVKIKDLYKEYLDLDKTFDAISRIEDKPKTEIEESDFAKDLYNLIEKELNVKMKICHGDFHTGNFLIDEGDEPFLIDFAFTDERHAILDHTTFECSLKFNHIPRYISILELEKLEAEFLSQDSFYPTFQVKASNRNDLKWYYGLVNQVRYNSIDFLFDQTTRYEYFVSLLIITIRQISYSDLNQLFAWTSAKNILNHIKQNL